MASSSDNLKYASSAFPANKAPKDVPSLQLLARAYN